MQTFLIVILSTYLVAVNIYGIVLLNYSKKYAFLKDYSKNKKNSDETNGDNIPKKYIDKYKVSDVKLLFTALLGGSVGIYVFMFILKHKLKNILLMILIPIFIALNVYLIILLFTTGRTYNY